MTPCFTPAHLHRGVQPRGRRRNGARAAGLHSLDALEAEQALANYHLLLSVRADLLAKLGRYAEAREELQRALAMTENRREQDLLTTKLNQSPVNDRSNW